MNDWTPERVALHNERVRLGKKGTDFADCKHPDAAERETGHGGLHEQIMEHCDKQWPKWKYRYSRPDKKTREELGTEDFTVFLPGGKTLHAECKSKGGKQSTEQLGWQLQLGQLGHKVYVVYSIEQFIELAQAEMRDSIRDLILQLRTEVNCRIEHGAESGGHLEYVQSKLDALLGQPTGAFGTSGVTPASRL